MTAIAPALMKGFRGTPFSCSSCTMELNAVPEGSRPTRFHSVSPTFPSANVNVKTFEMLWMEKGSWASPHDTISPLTVATAIPSFFGSILASSGM